MESKTKFMKTLSKKLSFIFVLLALSYSSGFSQWSTDPSVNNLVTNASGDQSVGPSVPDGSGGMILTFIDKSAPTANKIYAQRINSSGQNVWTSGGVLVTNTSETQRSPSICTDGAGGCIITWVQGLTISTIDVYAQRIRNDGVIMWSSGGSRVTQTSVYVEGVLCIPSGSGGCIIAWKWFDYVSSEEFGVLTTQKLNYEGTKLWASAGVEIERGNASGITVWDFRMCKDANDGVYFTFNRFSFPTIWDIYAQHLDTDGNKLWGTTGLAVVNADEPQGNVSMCEDGSGGFISVWVDDRNYPSQYSYYGARVNSSGTNLWGTNGKKVSDGIGSLFYCISDAYGGAYLIFRQEPGTSSGYNFLGQRIDYNGNQLWNAAGITLAERVDYIGAGYTPQVQVLDALGGLVVTWIGYKDTGLTQYGILSQRFNNSGTKLWGANGVFVSTGNLKKGLSLVSDGGSSGAIVAWADGRNYGTSGYDIYAQHVKADSTLGRPASGNGKNISVSQNFPNPFNPVTNISFDISESGFVSLKIFDMTGREIATLANGVYNPGEYSVKWDASNFATGAYLYKITANGVTEIKTMMLIK